MTVLPVDATDEQIKQLVIDWIAVVAEERYEEALAMLYQGNINPFWDSADPDGQRWTPELLQLVLTTYGVFDLQFDEGYRMDRVTDLRQEAFSRQFELERLQEQRWNLVPEEYAAMVHCWIPLRCDDPELDFAEDEISDLTLRMYVRRVPSGLALELSTIHSM
jgi:hypothetical protein